MIAQEKIQEYKKRLEAEREKLLQEIKTDESLLDFGSDVDHGDEEADEAEEMGNELAVERVLKARINLIDLALAKIAQGAYGVCEKCGAQIEGKILDIAPESKFCANCKKE